jgi:hypothetical protein
MLLSLLLLGCAPDGPAVTLTKPATSADDLVVEPPPDVGEHFLYQWSVDGIVQPDLVERRVPAERTQRGQTWAVDVVRLVGKRRSAPVRRRTVIDNGPPTVDGSILATSDGLVAVLHTDDPDADAVQLDISWVLDGAVRSKVATVGWPLLEEGQVWSLTVTPDDGQVEGEPLQLTYEVQAVPARLDSVVIVPSPLTTRAEARIARLPAVGGTEIATWFADGQLVYSGTPMPPFTVHRGQVVQVEVVVESAGVRTEPVRSPAVVVANTPPSITGATIEPEVLTESMAATCTVSGWSDPDGDVESVRAQWYVDEIYVGTFDALGGAFFERDDSVRCQAFPTDGADDGEPRWSQTVVVANTPPAMSALLLEPEQPVTGDTVTAVAEGAFDLDDDEISYEVEWFVDGIFVGTGLTLPVAVEEGQVIDASGWPTDGIDDGATIYALSTVVGNAGPVITDAAYSPDPPRAGQLLDVTHTVVDPEGDPVTEVRARWFIDDVEYDGDVIAAGELSAGQEVYVQLQGVDAHGVGPRVTLDTVTVVP